jgi:two-component system, chemotaxis family, protein-glutamate methylesterase/glutaminase
VLQNSLKWVTFRRSNYAASQTPSNGLVTTESPGPVPSGTMEAGRIYLAPADYHLLIEPTSVALSTPPPGNFARPSIDVLFESAAEAHGSARRIEERGCRVFVEDPATANSRPMPASVTAATSVDTVLPLPKLFEGLIAACN